MAGGDRLAIEEFYKRFFSTMLRDASILTGRDEQFCLDVVHDAMLKAVRCVKPIERKSQFSQFVRLLVRGVAYDHLRSELRRKKREEIHTSARLTTMENECIQTEARLTWIREQIVKLDNSAAELIRLRFQLGWTLRRIGARLGLGTGAVDGRIQRLVAKLKH